MSFPVLPHRLVSELSRTTGGNDQFDYGLDLLIAGLDLQKPRAT